MKNKQKIVIEIIPNIKKNSFTWEMQNENQFAYHEIIFALHRIMLELHKDEILNEGRISDN